MLDWHASYHECVASLQHASLRKAVDLFSLDLVSIAVRQMNRDMDAGSGLVVPPSMEVFRSRDLDLLKAQLGVSLTLYIWYLLCSTLGFLGIITPQIPTIYRAYSSGFPIFRGPTLGFGGPHPCLSPEVCWKKLRPLRKSTEESIKLPMDSYGCPSKNRGILPPKMDGENNGKPYEQTDGLGVFPYFWKHPLGGSSHLVSGQ